MLVAMLKTVTMIVMIVRIKIEIIEVSVMIISVGSFQSLPLMSIDSSLFAIPTAAPMIRERRHGPQAIQFVLPRRPFSSCLDLLLQ